MNTGLHAIVLAAGRAQRFGAPKLLAPWRGGVLLDGAIAAARAAPADSVIVVLGDGAARVREAAARHDVHFVEAGDYASGMAASLRAGLGALPGHARGAFVFLGDMPAIPHAIGARLAAALTADKLAAAPAYGGTRGHPVLFAAALFPRLKELTGDSGARRILDALGDGLATVPVDDPGVLFDVDTPADLAAGQPPQASRSG